MNQDEQHLQLLSIFHYVVAGLAGFFACFPLIHLAMGLVLIGISAAQPRDAGIVPAGMGCLVSSFAALVVLLGWTFAVCLALAGRHIGRRTRYTFCLVMAGVGCIFMPFGTILGVFSIIVLTRPSVKALFQQPAP